MWLKILKKYMENVKKCASQMWLKILKKYVENVKKWVSQMWLKSLVKQVKKITWKMFRNVPCKKKQT